MATEEEAKMVVTPNRSGRVRDPFPARARVRGVARLPPHNRLDEDDNDDDGDQLEGLCPELKTLKVLKKDKTLEEKKKQITLRMLLTHTAGFGYSFFNERLRDWGIPAGIDEFSGRVEDMISPLLFQPGEGWEYGVSETDLQNVVTKDI